MSSPKPSDYAIGWICAARVEFDTARLFLDEMYYGHEAKHVGPDMYFCGRIGRHKVVVLLLSIASSSHEYRTRATPESSKRAIKAMVQDFPNIRVVLAVGVGGGAPTQKNDIRLGDVVVGIAKGTNKGVFTYDIRKTLQSRHFESIEVFNPPFSIFAAYIATLEGYHRLPNHLLRQLWRPPQFTDQLCKNNIVHPKADQSCPTTCERDISEPVQRRQREGYEDAILIHYGTIASSSEPMEDASIRDVLATQADVLCFETEAYGILRELSCLVIRGIGNYSDSHESNLEWESYAAMSASFCAKELLRLVPPTAFNLQSVQKPSRFFRIGRCFVAQWVEPMSSRLETQSSTHTMPVANSVDGVFTEMRHFLVIRESYRSAWCVPIHTYQGRGTAKPDIRLYDHAKIYRFGNADPESEFPLRQPIGIVIERESELHQLHPASLANFGKVYTIEHDVPVMNIGYVPKLHMNRLKLDLNALEMSFPDMKYQRLRRDEGVFNIQLREKEKLDIQELDIGTEGSVVMILSGKSNATIQKLKGSHGTLSVKINGQGKLELGTVAVNGSIIISLSGESQVLIRELQEYSGFFIATITDEAKLIMEDVELMGGSIALRPSSRSQSTFKSLRGKGGSFSVESDTQAELRIDKAEFVESVISANINGESNLEIVFLRNDGGSFTARAYDKAVLLIGRAWLTGSSVTMMIGNNSTVTVNYLKGYETSLCGSISGLGVLNIKMEDCEVISGNIIERKDKQALSGDSKESGVSVMVRGAGNVSQEGQTRWITENTRRDSSKPCEKEI